MLFCWWNRPKLHSYEVIGRSTESLNLWLGGDSLDIGLDQHSWFSVAGLDRLRLHSQSICVAGARLAVLGGDQ